MNFFDYMFARIYTSKNEKMNKSVFSASGFISLPLSFYLVGTLPLFRLVLDIRSKDMIHAKPVVWILVLLPPIILWAWYSYRSKYKRVLAEFAETGKSVWKTASIWAYIILGPAFLISSSMAESKYEDKIIDRDKATETAVITYIIENEKASSFMYHYSYNGQQYNFRETFDLNKINIRSGDSCIVEFAASDPSLHRLAMNKDGTLKIKRKY